MANLSPGTSLGQYTIIRLIGRGGMGEVYEANELTLDRRVALKVIARDKVGSKHEGEIIQRFLQEARILAQVNHPNVVTIHAIDRHLETQFIAMEYIEGASFMDMVQLFAFSGEEAAPLFMQMLLGMQALHGKNILHRDLKPHNLMLRTDGQVKILDFGIAKRQGDNDPTDAGKKLVGTLPYMAPEVVLGSRADLRSDIWSLGVIFYEILVGHSFVSADGVELHGVRGRADSDVIFPKESLSRVHPEMREFISRMCDRDPLKRYSNFGEAVEDLKKYLVKRPAPMDFTKALCKIIEGIDLIRAGFDPEKASEPSEKRAFAVALLKEVSVNFAAEKISQPIDVPTMDLVSATSDSVASRKKARKKIRRENRSPMWQVVALVNAALLVIVVFWFGGVKRAPKQEPARAAASAESVREIPKTVNLMAPAPGQALWLAPAEAPAFSWSRAVAPGEYQIEIAADKEFKKAILTANVDGTSYRPSQALPEGVYFWRLTGVKGQAAGGFSMFTLSTVAPLDLLGPKAESNFTLTGKERDMPVEFGWACKPGADSYHLQISRSAGFENVVKEGNLNLCTGNWIRVPAGEFFWRARVETPAVDRNPWSGPVTFSVQRKAPAAPAVAVKPKPAPAPVVAEEKPVEKPVPVKRRVASEKPPEKPAVPEVKIFQAPSPSKIKDTFVFKFSEQDMSRDPASVRTHVTVPQMAWSPVEGARMYKIEISRTPDFTQIIERTATQSTHFDWTKANPGRYFWRVTSVGDTASATSLGCQLDVRLPAPALSSSYSDSPRGFEWESIPLAERYIVEWDHSKTMANKSQKLTKDAQIQLDMSQGNLYVRVATANRKGERTSEFSRVARILTLP